MKHWILPLLLLLSLSSAVEADEYEQALRAEADKDWIAAERHYRQALEDEPDNAELWQRLADVQAAAGKQEAAADSMLRATEVAEADAELFASASAAHADVDQPRMALELITRATELAPDRAEYWRDRALIASWLGETTLAIEAYRRALELDPSTTSIQLSLALNEAWSGNLDQAAGNVREYLADFPDDRQAWLYLADFEIWRGNYAGALEALENYRELEGRDSAYDRKRAQALAWARRRDEAMQLIEPMLAERPDDPELLYLNTLALRNTRPEAAMRSLEMLEEQKPDDKEVIDLGRSTRTPYRPKVALEASRFEDSDSIRMDELGLAGSIRAGLHTELSLRARRLSAEADAGTGLDPIDGSGSIDTQMVEAAIVHRLNPNAELTVGLGQSEADGTESLTRFKVGGRFRMSDSIALELVHSRDRVAISPRTLSLGLNRHSTEARIELSPSVSNYLEFAVSRQHFSDDNRRTGIVGAWRNATVRSQNWNIDLGASGGWTGFRDQNGNGYYAPDRYRYLALTVGAYWKITDDDGISINVAAGGQKDENMSDVEFYGDASIEGIFGIYRDWMLRLKAAYSDRQQQTGGFDATQVSALIERRF